MIHVLKNQVYLIVNACLYIVFYNFYDLLIEYYLSNVLYRKKCHITERCINNLKKIEDAVLSKNNLINLIEFAIT